MTPASARADGGAEGDAARIRRRVVVHGLVQGVFFRDSTRREADRLGVAGTVRNEADGTVRADIEGPPEAVERMLAWLRHGPPRAHVSGIDVLPQPPAGARGFTVT